MRSLFVFGCALLLAVTNAQTFKWTSSGAVVAPKNDGRGIVAVKDPTAVYYNGAYHLFMTSASGSGYNMIYTNFTDWNNAKNSKYYYMADNAIGAGYKCAPQVFYFAPQKLWYLVFQNGNAAYSTNKDISNFKGWSAPRNFYNGMPATIRNNMGKGNWVDMWVICDSANCHLFSSDDNGHLYRSQTSINNFPNGMGEPVIALSESDPKNLYEASNVYKVGSKYLIIVECTTSSWQRYFRSWTAPSISGPYKKFADTFQNPFAGTSNIQFNSGKWTNDISHGDVVRRSPDQTMEIKDCQPEFIYQGRDPSSSASYDALPYRLGVLKATSNVCSAVAGA